MMKKLVLFFSLIVLVFSCSDTNTSFKESAGELYDTYPEVEINEMATREAASDVSTTTPIQDVTIEQKLIKTSYLTFETHSVVETYQEIKKKIEAYKGYIQNDNTTKEYNRISRSLLIRIPNKKFQPLVDSITKSVKSLDRRDIQLRDVTEEFVDLEARLKAKRKLEERYLQLLAKANSVKDMLEIERQIAQIREEIEAKQGRLKYLQSKVSFSTIHLSFYEMMPDVKAPSQTYASRLWRAVKGGFTGVGEFFIGVVYIWPFILITIFIAFYIRRRIRKNK